MDRKSFLFGLIAGIVISGFSFIFYLNLETSNKESKVAFENNSQEKMRQALMVEIEKLEEEVKDKPDDMKLLTSLGNFYFDLGETDKAINTYKKVLSAEPDNDAVLVDCGVMYRSKGDFDKAIEYLDKALRINPENKQALFNKTIIYKFDLNDLEAAQKSFKELQDKFPDDPHISAFSKELGL